MVCMGVGVGRDTVNYHSIVSVTLLIICIFTKSSCSTEAPKRKPKTTTTTTTTNNNNNLVDDPILRQICKVHTTNSIVGLCFGDLEALRPLSPLVLLTKEATDNAFYVYPSSYVVRPRRSRDRTAPDHCGDGNPPISLIRVPGMDLVRDPTSDKITNLRGVVRDVTDVEEDGGDDERGGVVMGMMRTMEADAVRFLDCLEGRSTVSSLVSAEVGTNGETTTTGKKKKKTPSNTIACHKIALDSFRWVSAMLNRISESHDRRALNQLLRNIVSVWGGPKRIGSLMLVVGCDTSDSYDEFLSCRMVLGDVVLEVNVHQRNGEGSGGGGGDGHEEVWTCRTCGLHQHPRWFASRVTAGTVTYTMSQPTCPPIPSKTCSPHHQATTTPPPPNNPPPFPTAHSLDNPHLSHATSSGTLLDVVGSRYTLGRSDVLWETTEVLPLTVNQTLVFAPQWYHRVVPPGVNSEYAAVTMVATYGRDTVRVIDGLAKGFPRDFGSGGDKEGGYVLAPSEIRVGATEKGTGGYDLMGIIEKLRDDGLDVERGVKLGGDV